VSRNCRFNGAGAAVRNNTVGTTASVTSSNSRGIAGAHDVRNIIATAAASAQSVRAKFVSTTAGVQATRVNLIGTIAISRQYMLLDARACRRAGAEVFISGELELGPNLLNPPDQGTLAGRLAQPVGVNLGRRGGSRGRRRQGTDARRAAVGTRVHGGLRNPGAVNRVPDDPGSVTASIKVNRGLEIVGSMGDDAKKADVLNGHLGQVRVRLVLGQARSLGGTIKGGRAMALDGDVRNVRARHK
jgi:hypothetical protein